MSKQIVLMDTQLMLLAERALFLPEYGTLVVADWHLGKSAHFRKAGIFMPVVPMDRDTARLQSLLDRLPVHTTVFLGDLFHSELNSEWLSFERFLAANPNVQFVLTRGNHDILPDELFERAGVRVVARYEVAPHVHCTHHPGDGMPAGVLHIAGHVHPGCVIPARGRKMYRLPCFYHCGQTLLLPAFGSLTGMYPVQRSNGACVYPVAGEEVWEWKKN